VVKYKELQSYVIFVGNYKKVDFIRRNIPNALTLANLACGFAAIMTADFYWSPILLICSFIFDALDGLVARSLGVNSEFGKELDSLCDIVSFGVAPAYLYSLAAPDSAILSIDTLLSGETSLMCRIAPIFIVLAGAIRLAKFNTLPSLPYFKGLPIPSSAIFFIGLIFSIQNGSPLIENLLSNKLIYISLPIIFGILMISFPIRMFSIKGMTSRWQDNIFHIALVAIAIIVFIFFKFESLSFIVIAYVLLSFLYHFVTPSQDLH
jgi:CDP-diacylglycerol---serine O-phosphatidyltransferase